MSRFLFSILLFIQAYSQVLFRLNTQQTTTLQVNQSITSTLGLFKATLRQHNCSLQIFQFNNATYTYQSKGFYISPNLSLNCTNITIQQGQIVTSQNETLMWLGNTFNQSTIFTIDDLGVIRLIGTYISSNNVNQYSTQQNVTDFEVTNTYIYAGSQLNVKFTSTFAPLVNLNNWTYSASLGQLDIFYSPNQNMLVSYVYSAFKLNNSEIQDFNSNSFPSAIFANITYSPRCFEPRIYLNFKPPFIIMADPYWPKLTVMEQGGYKVFQFVYAQFSEYSYSQSVRDNFYVREFSLCPDYTFEFQGKCLLNCPAPYFHEMRGKAGSCRLVCEEYTPIDLTNRICTCMDSYSAPQYNTEYIKPCPSNAKKYPYGCYCTNPGEYFDNKLNFSCITTCPNGTLAYSGLCVNCPNNCLICQQDGYSRMFLECKTCQSGYKLIDGQCFNSCNSNLAYSLNPKGACIQCADPNCIECVTDANTCTKCGLLYALSNNSCIQSCPSNTTLSIAQPFQSQCLISADPDCKDYLVASYKNKAFVKCDVCLNGLVSHLDGCVTSCPSGYKNYAYQGYSYCSCQIGLTIYDKCLNITNCPIKMYYDVYSDSCLSCPFGCITCKESLCTSCFPGYFLYISPQAIICRRSSPLFACAEQYSLYNGVCLVTAYNTLQMNLCIQNIPNCKTCPYQANYNTAVCLLCLPGFYLYNNTCVSQCPTNFTVYQNLSCILLQITNCQVPFLKSVRQSSIINMTLRDNSNPYKYYIDNDIEPANDPVGYIPYFQELTSYNKNTDGLYRQDNFFAPHWTCLKCVSGYGLNSNFSQCLPCVDPCITCYMALNTSCLTLKSNGNSTNNNTNSSNTSCQGYIDFISKSCIQSCNSTTSYPQMINKTLFCVSAQSATVSDYVRIDSAIYSQTDGSKIVYFVFDKQIPEATNITVRIQKPNTNRLLQSYTEITVPIKDQSYFQVTANPGENVIVADFSKSIQNLQSTSGYFPPNLVYGSQSLNTHPQFMKTWLAIIGEIMSVVIIAMHCVFVGNQLLYKMDNLIILAETIYFFSFVKVLVGDLLAQFYYGWIFSHIGFFPNFFSTPSYYRQDSAPISYKLAVTDANFIRNAGYSISLLIVFIGSWLLVTGVVYLLYKKFNKKQIWYPQIAQCSLIAGIQLFSMNLMYWAIAEFMYNGQCTNCDQYYKNLSLAWAIIFTILICGYTIGRFFFNAVAGLYMAKRVLIAVILPAAFNDLNYIAPLLILQILFVIARFLIQRPELKKQKLYILLQFGAMLLVYLLLFICNNSGVNTIIISIVIFIYMVFLMSDFSVVYLESVNEWQLQSQNQQEQVKSGLQKAQTFDQVVPGSQMRQMQLLKNH